VSSGNTLTINQTTDRAILNWASFNVSADGHVIFNQPATTSIALNRIYQSSPSRIFGQVQANGEIYLVNPNGVIFGKTSTINAAGILASTLGISDSTFAAGIASPGLVQNGLPALQSDGRINVLDADGNPIRGTIDANGNIVADPNGDPIKVQLVVQDGAKLATNVANGRILLASQNVDNSGSITAADGQVILAAGDKVFLQASTDPALRGLLVEVGADGTAWNRLTGAINTPRGDTTMIGFAVNQDGRISASTTVSANGSIRLLARDSATVEFSNGTGQLTATRTGDLEFGASSVTSILPELDDTQTAVDDQKQEASHVEAMGHHVTLKGGSMIRANGGRLDLAAVQDPRATLAANTLNPGAIDPDSRLRIESGAVIDLSGSDVTLPMSRNMVTVELRANELRDSPNQRDSAIRGVPLVVDARVGTPLGDIRGAIAAIPKSVAERTSAGGTAAIVSDGDIVAAGGSLIDVSGGVINYASGVVQTSQLVGADGKIYDIGSADPARSYIGAISPSIRRVDDRWGQITTTPLQSTGRLELGYIEGKSAGTLQFAAPTLVLNGTMVATAPAGPFQRSPGLAPAGGDLIIGVSQGIGFAPNLDYRAPSVSFTATAPPIVVADGAPLPGPRTLELPIDYLNNGFTRTEINSNGTVTIPGDTPLNLVPGSTLQLAGQRVDVLSDITDLSGSIQLSTRDTFGIDGILKPDEAINIGTFVTLDVRGTWINDELVPVGVRALDPLLQNGGSISLKLGGTSGPAELVFGDDVSLRASGGAQFTQKGATVAGRGGSISLLTTRFGQVPDATIVFGNDLKLDAFGVLGASGGSFSLSTSAIQIVQDDVWAQPQTLATTQPDAFLHIGTGLFSNYGFSQFQLTANRPGAASGGADVFDVVAGVDLHAQVKSLQLDGLALGRPSGGVIDGFSEVFLAPPDRRLGASIALRAGQSRGDSSDAGDLTVHAGAVLSGDPGSNFAFSSVGNLVIEGTVRAPGGSIRADLFAPPVASGVTDSGYLGGQELRVGATGVLDASGTTVLKPNDGGLLRGQVLPGGLISLAADRGSVSLDAGSLLDVSGTASPLDVPTQDSAAPYVRETVASAAGAISLRAREGISLLGDMHALAGVGDVGKAAAGSLSLGIERLPPPIAGDTYPAGSAVVKLTAHDETPAGTPAAGVAELSQDFITRSGFDSVTLRAFDAASSTGGEIVLEPGVNLTLGRQLSLAAPRIAVAGAGDVQLAANYVSIGDSLSASAAVAPVTGAGSLQINGSMIDLLGSTALDSMQSASFESNGDIRLRGTPASDGSVPGSLTIAGDLAFSAARVYASTGTQFTLTAAGGTNDRIEFLQHGSVSGSPLAVGSSLRVVARDITQGGTLLAPFGSISLEATDAVSLLDGSLTSVSGAGGLYPYGGVLNGTWTFNNGIAAPGNFEALPARQVALKGDTVAVNPSAVVDMSGGGDLYAYEWVPGSGGSRDALAPGVTPGLYAVLPSLAGQYAPIDPQEFAGSDLKPGDSIYLSGLGDLPAGVYPLLPARYALLPGAFLVSAVAGTNDLVPGAVTSLADGTRVIAGYRTFGDTQFGSNQFSGFAIRPGSYGRALAQYDDFRASTFLANRAAQLELGRVTLPADAGSFSLFVGSELDARGVVRTAAATGGQGATIDVSALRLAVTSGPGDGAPDTVDISSDTLKAWNPARLILGGHLDSASASALDVSASEVQIKAGASLAFDEVLIAARDRLAIDDGATVASRSGVDSRASVNLGAEPVHLDLAGDDSANAAVVAVSDLADLRFDRSTSSAAAGAVDIAAGAQIASRGSLSLEAPGGGAVNGALAISGAHASIDAGRLVFGTQPEAGALLVDPGLQSQLQTASALRIAASDSIDFERDASLNLGTASGSVIEISAPQLLAAPGVAVSAHATEIALDGGPATSAAAPAGGTATFDLSAQTLQLDAGAMDMTGFGQTNWTATQQVLSRGASQYRIGGDLTVSAPVVNIAADAETSIDASEGAVRLANNGSPAMASTTYAGLGGSFTVIGDSIDDSLAIVAPSGLVSLQSRGGLDLNDGAVIDVAGRMVSAGGRQVGSSGGSIQLTANGELNGSAGTTLKLDGTGDSSAGRLVIGTSGAASLSSALSAHPGSLARGGSVDVVAASVADFASLNASFESAGFTDSRRVHVGNGDLALAARTTTTAHTFELVSDTGSVQVSGLIDASSDEGTRGSVRLYGGAGVSLDAGAAVSTDATGSALHGGDIEIGTTTGNVALAATSRLSALGPASDGTLIIRGPATANDIAVNSLSADLSRLARVTLAPVFVTDVSGSAAPQQLSDATSAAADFATNAGPGILARFSGSSGAPIVLRPDVELRSAGDLDLNSIDLTSWRFAGEPGSLTVRAGGSVRVNGTISDGFLSSGVGANARVTLLPGEASSIHITAGADLGSVDPTATALNSKGDLVLGANSQVRTGTGSLSLGAARDLVFNAGASVYTGGLPAAATQLLPARVGTVAVSFPDQGGNIALTAGRDVTGSPLAQSVTSWQFRGTRAGAAQPLPRLWGINFAGFGWNTGAMGGGDVIISAGRDVNDLSATAADSALVDASETVVNFGGGSMQLTSGRDISSGDFYTARGLMTLEADGALASDRTSAAGDALGSLLWLGDTRATVDARRDILIESVLNPTVLAVPNAPASGPRSSAFFTYSNDASLRLDSTSGLVLLQNSRDRLGAFLEPAVLGSFPENYAMYPPSLTVGSRSGDISIERLAYMFPSAHGQLDLFATGDIRSAGSGGIVLSDGDPSAINTVVNPAVGAALLTEMLKSASASIHVNDADPALVTAGRDISNLLLFLAKPARITAGRDIVDYLVIGQNLRADDLTLISAGRDIKASASNPSAEIAIGGPGRLDLLAGRDVDLGFSQGVVTTGRLANASLPSDIGASITVATGLGGKSDYSNFITKIIAPSTDYRQTLIDYVSTLTGATLSFDDALATFRTFGADQQRPFIDKVFFAELVKSGREANTTPAAGFSRGYVAIDALYPGSRNATSNPYAGNLNMSFSRIYTLAGGDISLLVPGGLLNVGLANPPGGLQRDPSLLGIVAQRQGDVSIFTSGDVLVNQSRVFTLLGGDIAIWSTMGNIDAGRGAKTSVSAPPPRVIVDASGKVTLDLSAAAAGSGIRTIVTGKGVEPGDVDLIAPAGFVNAGDAGIGSAGNLNIAAATVVGLDNIQVGGTSTGVPAEAGGLGASLAGVSSVGSSSSNAAGDAVSGNEAKQPAAPIAQDALSWLDVFVTGFGEENCKPDDIDCLKRQKSEGH
jgi:filamentous hemagglutinin family protein